MLMPMLLAACVTVTSGGVINNKPDLPKAARINTQLGSEYAREGMYPIAEQKLKLAISQQDDYAPAYLALAYVYAKTNKTEKAEAAYRRALDLAPDNPDAQNNFGVFLCNEGKGKEAQVHFRKAIQNPNYSTPEAAWTNAGVCPGTSPKVAESDFLHALHLNPQFPAALKQMAIISFSRKQYRRARAFEQRYRKVAKPGPRMLLLSARTERALGNEDQAASYEEQLIREYPASPQANDIGSDQTP